MDPSHCLTHTRSSPVLGVTPYLPSYEEANLSYSYRLPTYRSSYIRRYHPYARYNVPPTRAYFMDCDDFLLCDEASIDLPIFVRATLPMGPAPDQERIGNDFDAYAEGHAEPRLDIMNPDRAEIDVGGDRDEQDQLHDDRARQKDLFCKLDIMPSFAALCNH